MSTPYDVGLADQLAEVLTGGPQGDMTHETTQDELRNLEREKFVGLIKEKRTYKRIMHMLNTNKPLREGPDPKKRTSHALRAEMRKPSLISRLTSPFRSAAKPAANTNAPTCDLAPKQPKADAAVQDNAPKAEQEKKPQNDQQPQPAAQKGKKAGNGPAR